MVHASPFVLWVSQFTVHIFGSRFAGHSSGFTFAIHGSRLAVCKPGLAIWVHCGHFTCMDGQMGATSHCWFLVCCEIQSGSLVLDPPRSLCRAVAHVIQKIEGMQQELQLQQPQHQQHRQAQPSAAVADEAESQPCAIKPGDQSAPIPPVSDHASSAPTFVGMQSPQAWTHSSPSQDGTSASALEPADSQLLSLLRPKPLQATGGRLAGGGGRAREGAEAAEGDAGWLRRAMALLDALPRLVRRLTAPYRTPLTRQLTWILHSSELRHAPRAGSSSYRDGCGCCSACRKAVGTYLLSQASLSQLVLSTLKLS